LAYHSSDSDGTIASYAWTRTGGTGGAITLSSATTSQPTFTADTLTSNDTAVTHIFSLVVTDDDGATSTADTVTITVQPPANAAPTANAGPDQGNVASGATVALYGASSSDSDGTIASYAWTRTGGTGGAITLSSATASQPTFTADTLTSNDTAVTHIFSLVVTDDDGATSTADTVTITVQPPANAAPTANAGPDQGNVASGATVALYGASSSDSDGTIASYAWTRTGGTGGAITLSSATASQPTFTADTLTSNDTAVTHIFSLVVTDDDGATSTADTVTITVQPPANAAPTANAGPDQGNVASGATVALYGASSSDSDGTIASYAWTRTGGTGGAITLSSATASQPTFTADTLTSNDTAVTHTFSLVVTDDDGATSTADTVTITVQPPANAAPTANAGPDQGNVASGATVALYGASSSDSDGTIASYAWTRTGGTGGAITLSSATASQPTFTADTLTSNDTAVTHTFSLVVTDDDGATSTADTVTITVQPPANAAPTANAGPDQGSVASGATVTLDGTGSSDSDGTIASYAWTRTGGTGGAITLSSATASQPTFTADTLTPGSASVTHIFSLTVIDDDGTTSTTDTIIVTIQSGPTVSISGQPADYSGVISFDVLITFSKSVTGFVAGDITITGGAVTNLTGSGAGYTATITTSGGGDLSLTIPANIATDGAGNGNAASNAVGVSNTVVAEVQQQTSEFVLNRASSVIATMPDFGGFLGGGASLSTKGFYLNLRDNNGVMDLSGSLTPFVSSKNYVGKTVVWYQLRGVRSETVSTASDLLVGYVGGHFFLGERTLVGAVLLADFSSESNAGPNSSGSGRGFMVGPYFATDIGKSNLKFEGQALWGKSVNRISPIGTYTDQYYTERWMVRAKVDGDIQRGLWTISPGASVSYFSETQAPYTDSLANAIPAQTVALGEVKLGSDFARSFEAKNGNIIEMKLGLAAVTNFSITNSSGSQGFPLGSGTVRSRIDFGLSTLTDNNWNLSFNVFYDGIGVTGYKSYGGTVRASIRF
jgi:K319L-like, PKD domain/Bacterial Ig-like domain